MSDTMSTEDPTASAPFWLTDLPTWLMLALVAVGLPRTILTDLAVVPPESGPLYYVLALAPFAAWLSVATVRPTRKPIADFLRQAIEIDDIEPVDTGRSVVNGKILRSGHPVYDKYVGNESPIQGLRNPVTYIDDDGVDGRACKCGCGDHVAGRDFLPGHDQTALHARVKQIGTVAEFLDWFDIVRGNKPVDA